MIPLRDPLTASSSQRSRASISSCAATYDEVAFSVSHLTFASLASSVFARTSTPHGRSQQAMLYIDL